MGPRSFFGFCRTVAEKGVAARWRCFDGCLDDTKCARIKTLALAQLYMNLKSLVEHFPGHSIPPISVPEPSFPRGELLMSADPQKCPTMPGIFFYVKIRYSEQLLISQQLTFVSQKFAQHCLKVMSYSLQNIFKAHRPMKEQCYI